MKGHTEYNHEVNHSVIRNQMFQARQYEAYLKRDKWGEPTHCPDCGAVYHKGRWQWSAAALESMPHQCPACARIHDKIAAGFLYLRGAFFMQHKDEIMHLIRNQEQKEKVEHPLERIMAIVDERLGITIHYTGVHLTQATGKALHHAYHGTLDIVHNDPDAQMRVYWQR